MVTGSLKGEKVLVAGGAGFVGSQLVRELLDDGAKVIVYDNFHHGVRSNLTDVSDDIQLIVGDILDDWKLHRVFQSEKPKYVFDLVGDTYVPTAYDVPKRFFRINVEGTMNLLMASKLYGVERILYVSSTEVYGEARHVPMKEEHPLHPLNTYAVSKLAADRLCFTFNKEHEVPVIIARIYNSYGPRESEPYVVPEIIAQLNKSTDLHLGNIDAQRDFTFVSDTARGLMATMMSDIPNGEAVNVGSGKAYAIKDLAKLIADAMGVKKYEIKVDPRRLRKLDILLFQSDSSKLNKATGWKPKVDIKDGLKRTVDWFNSHGKKWSWEDWTEGTVVYDSKS